MGIFVLCVCVCVCVCLFVCISLTRFDECPTPQVMHGLGSLYKPVCVCLFVCVYRPESVWVSVCCVKHAYSHIVRGDLHSPEGRNATSVREKEKEKERARARAKERSSFPMIEHELLFSRCN